MCDFLGSSELWSNVIGGVITGIVLAGLVWLWNWNKRRHIKALIKIEDESIEHRNAGAAKEYEDTDKWSKEARIIHDKAFETANKISPAAGALIDLLGVVDPWDPTDTVSYWISILTKVNGRIRKILEHHI